MAISLGSKTQVNSSGFEENPLSVDVIGQSSNYGVLVYEISNVLYYRAFSVTGTTPTLDTETNLDSVTVAECQVLRMDNDYGIFHWNTSGSNPNRTRIFSRSGTTLTLGSEQSSGISGNFGCSGALLDDTTLVTAKAYNGASDILYTIIGTITKVTKSTSYGSNQSKSLNRNAGIINIDTFNDTYGIVALNTSYNSSDQLIVFSVSGSTVTYGSLTSLDYPPASRAYNVFCINDTKVLVQYYEYDAGDSNWDLKIKLMTRSGTTLTDQNDILIEEGISTLNRREYTFAQHPTNENYIIFFYYNEGDSNVYAVQLLIDGNDLSVFDTVQINDSTTSRGVTAIDFFPDASNSVIFAYNDTDVGLDSYIKIGNPTWGEFTPRTMII